MYLEDVMCLNSMNASHSRHHVNAIHVINRSLDLHCNQPAGVVCWPAATGRSHNSHTVPIRLGSCTGGCTCVNQGSKQMQPCSSQLCVYMLIGSGQLQELCGQYRSPHMGNRSAKLMQVLTDCKQFSLSWHSSMHRGLSGSSTSYRIYNSLTDT